LTRSKQAENHPTDHNWIRIWASCSWAAQTV